MAEFEWTTPVRPSAPSAAPALAKRILGNYLDWEDWLTFGLMLGGILSVTMTLEAEGWSRHMPPITLIALIAAGAALLLARPALPALLALPLALVTGALVVIWQTLVLAGPGDIEQRAHNVYFRFDGWFDIAVHGGVSNDSLPFNVLVMGLTWLGVFIAGWGVFRWNNAWIGILPGSLVLFLDEALVGDPLTATTAFYVLFGFLLLMRTTLMARMARWREEGSPYPPLLSITVLNFSGWFLVALLTAAWIAPTGPFSTPAPVQSVVERLTNSGIGFVRLAGPLQTRKIIPVHDYTGVLPFQGSVDLGNRQVLAVKPEDPLLRGPIALRGAVYDSYTSGGWEAGARTETPLPAFLEDRIRDAITNEEADGQLISMKVSVTAKSIVGSVLFTTGQPVAADRPLRVEVPANSLRSTAVTSGMSDGTPDADILRDGVSTESFGLQVERNEYGRVTGVRVFDAADQPVPDSVVLRPGDRLEEGQSYRITSFVSTATADDLRAAGDTYPDWVSGQYLQLPDTLPQRVVDRARDLAGEKATAYEKAIAIQEFLRAIPVNYRAGDTPPGADTVDHFLFESQRGYFDYHASAMVVMLRAAGVPSRLAVGYVVDENDFDSESRTYAVRDSDSYTWAEVYFPKHGWIAFNPSPDRPADLRPTREIPEAPEPVPIFDAPPYEPLGADPIFDISPGAGQPGVPPAISGGSDPGYALWIALGALAFAAAVYGAAALGWRRSVAGLPHAQQMWEKTVRLAGWAGHGPEPGQTPAEYARRLERRFRGVRGVALLAAVYARSRFGRGEPSDSERAELDNMWPHLRGALIGGIAGRLSRRRRRG